LLIDHAVIAPGCATIYLQTPTAVTTDGCFVQLPADGSSKLICEDSL